jgi:hypothetical protein
LFEHQLDVHSHEWRSDLHGAGYSMNDNEIEKEIQAKGLIAPRVTLADIEAVIAWEIYTNASELTRRNPWVAGPAQESVPQPEGALSLVTLCVLVLENGFKVVGEASCVSPENFNAELGRKVARQNAIDKVWMLEGYLLKQSLYDDANPIQERAREVARRRDAGEEGV